MTREPRRRNLSPVLGLLAAAIFTTLVVGAAAGYAVESETTTVEVQLSDASQHEAEHVYLYGNLDAEEQAVVDKIRANESTSIAGSFHGETGGTIAVAHAASGEFIVFDLSSDDSDFLFGIAAVTSAICAAGAVGVYSRESGNWVPSVTVLCVLLGVGFLVLGVI